MDIRHSMHKDVDYLWTFSGLFVDSLARFSCYDRISESMFNRPTAQDVDLLTYPSPTTSTLTSSIPLLVSHLYHEQLKQHDAEQYMSPQDAP